VNWVDFKMRGSTGKKKSVSKKNEQKKNYIQDNIKMSNIIVLYLKATRFELLVDLHQVIKYTVVSLMLVDI